MTALRALLRSHPPFAALIVAAALLLRIVVPAGFMPDFDHGRVTLTICTGSGPMKMTMPMPGVTHQGEAPAAQSPCAYADLALPGLPAVDPVLLVAAILFAFAAALLPLVARAPRTATRLRPPLRGPPLSA